MYPRYRLQTSGTAATNPTFEGWFTNDEQPEDAILVIAAHNDGGTSALTITDSHASDPDLGWVEINGAAPNNGGCRTAVWYRRVGASPIAQPTIAGTTDEWAGIAWAMTGIDATTALDVSAVTEQSVNTQTPIAPTATTTVNNCVVFRIVGRDGGTAGGQSLPSEQIGKWLLLGCVADSDSATAVLASCCVAMQVQETAGSVGTFSFADVLSDGGRQMTVAFRVASGAALPAFVKPITNCLVAGPCPDTTYYSTPVDFSTITASFLGDTVQAGAASLADVAADGSLVSVADGIVGPYTELRSSQAATPSGPAGYYGAIATIVNGPVDWQTNMFGAVLRCVAGNQRAADVPNLIFRDSLGAWAAVRPLSRVGFNNWAFTLCHLPDITPVASSGTIDWSDITQIGFVKYATNNGGASARSQTVSFKYLFGVPVGAQLASIHGAADVQALKDFLLSFGAGSTTGNIQGGVQLLTKLPLQIGDGTSPVTFDGEGVSLAFPKGIDGFSVNDDDIELRLDLGASDNVSLSSMAVVAQGKKIDFHIDAASDATSLTGTAAVLIGQNIDNANGQDWTGATIIGAGKHLLYGATLTSCTIKDTTATDAAANWSANGGMVNGTVDLTGATCSHHIELGASVTAFDLTNDNDTAFAGSASVSNIKVLRTTGTVTITLALGQTEPTYTSSGATVVFDQPILATTWTNPDLADGTTILVRNIDTSTTIAYVASLATGTGYSITLVPGVDYTPGDEIQVWQSRKAGTTYYVERTSRIITSAGGGTITEADALAECDICTAFNLDGATPPISTKFSADLVDDEIDIDVGAPWQMAEAMVWFKTQMTIQASMEDLWGTCVVQGDGSFYNPSALTKLVKFDNTTANDAIESTNRRFYNDLGTRPIKSPLTGTGQLDFQWREPVSVVAVGSGVLPADVTAIADAVHDKETETGFSLARTVRITAAAVAGKTSGGPTGFVARNLTDTADQITGTADASGNRTGATYGT